MSRATSRSARPSGRSSTGSGGSTCWSTTRAPARAGPPRRAPSNRTSACSMSTSSALVRMTKAVLPHMRAQADRTDHQHLLGPRIRPRCPSVRQLRRDQARDRGLLRVGRPRGPRARCPRAARRAGLHQDRLRRHRRAARTHRSPIYANQRHGFDDVIAVPWRTAMTRRSSPRRSSRPPRIRSRSCAIPPARRRDGQRRCGASFRRGSSTSRSASSTACPPEASTLPRPHPEENRHGHHQ